MYIHSQQLCPGLNLFNLVSIKPKYDACFRWIYLLYSSDYHRSNFMCKMRKSNDNQMSHFVLIEEKMCRPPNVTREVIRYENVVVIIPIKLGN